MTDNLRAINLYLRSGVEVEGLIGNRNCATGRSSTSCYMGRAIDG